MTDRLVGNGLIASGRSSPSLRPHEHADEHPSQGRDKPHDQDLSQLLTQVEAFASCYHQGNGDVQEDHTNEHVLKYAHPTPLLDSESIYVRLRSKSGSFKF